MPNKILRFQLDDANPGDAEVVRILGELSPSTAKNYLTSAVLYYSRSPLLSLNDSMQKILSKVSGMEGLLQSIQGTVDNLHAKGITPVPVSGTGSVLGAMVGQEGNCELDDAVTLRLKSLLSAAEI